MTAPNGDAAPEPLRGRFKLTPAEHGGAILTAAKGLCDRCLNCQCGTQLFDPPLDLTPAGTVKSFLRLRQMQKDGIG